MSGQAVKKMTDDYEKRIKSSKPKKIQPSSESDTNDMNSILNNHNNKQSSNDLKHPNESDTDSNSGKNNNNDSDNDTDQKDQPNEPKKSTNDDSKSPPVGVMNKETVINIKSAKINMKDNSTDLSNLTAAERWEKMQNELLDSKKRIYLKYGFENEYLKLKDNKVVEYPNKQTNMDLIFETAFETKNTDDLMECIMSRLERYDKLSKDDPDKYKSLLCGDLTEIRKRDLKLIEKENDTLYNWFVHVNYSKKDKVCGEFIIVSAKTKEKAYKYCINWLKSPNNNKKNLSNASTNKNIDSDSDNQYIFSEKEIKSFIKQIERKDVRIVKLPIISKGKVVMESY